jgi:hemoglobin-like flavoprotein
MVALEPSEIQLVQQTFAMVNCVSVTASQMFFNRLFELDPKLRSLFTIDMHSHRVKFMATLRFMVDSLDEPQALDSITRQMGQLHGEKGVQNAQYETVEQALLWMLQRTLGRSFTPEVRNAWIKAYALIAAKMQEAAHEFVT